MKPDTTYSDLGIYEAFASDLALCLRLPRKRNAHERFSSFGRVGCRVGVLASINCVAGGNGGGAVPRRRVSRRVTSRMRFRFKDGSICEETTVFSQQGTFRLVSDHVLQKGPTFKRPMDIEIDAASGQVKVRYTDDGKQKVLTERVDLPHDVANGILFTLLKNIQRHASSTMVSYVAATPKPRIVHLEILPQGQEPFSIGSYSHKAIHYVVKVKIGGVEGWVAHVLGKQPPDTQTWILGDDAPAFVRSDGPLYGDGPIWRMELATPAAWPASTAAVRSQK